MEPTAAERSFLTTGDAYDHFMGRYSRSLARPFADLADIVVGQRVLDVGCGPGALTGELVARLGSSSVCAVDQSEPFVASCIQRHPGVDVRLGRAEQIPFDDSVFDAVLAQLVLHFVSDTPSAMADMVRVVRPGGRIAACVWDVRIGMEMLHSFWAAAQELDPAIPGEAGHLRFGDEGELHTLFTAAGLVDVSESTLQVSSAYADFDDLWSGFLRGIGPAGSYLVALPSEHREALRTRLFRRLGEPAGGLTLAATARCATGTAPA